MYAPEGTVMLGHVPWDDSYKHIFQTGLANPSATLGFMSMETDFYKFIREDSNIMVPYNADTLYGINYCAYQNSGKWFFCFVNTITFVNNNTSLLHLEEDIWQTWGGSLTIAPCLVAREHVSGDGLGQHRAAEPAMSLESVVLQSVDSFPELAGACVVVGVNAIPHLKNGGDIFGAHNEDDFDGSDAVAGGNYSGIYSGCRLYAFDLTDVALAHFLDNLNMCGAAESVACMYMVPADMISIGGGHEVAGYVGVQDGSFSAPQTLGNGYTPRNKKCLTYPYSYTVITDNCGGTMELKNEDCDTWGTFDYKLVQGLDATASVYYVPCNYTGQAIDNSHMMPIHQNPQCSWVYAAYQNWLAQNAPNLQTKTNIAWATIAGSVIALVAAGFLTATGVGAPEGAAIGSAALGGITAASAGLGLNAGKELMSIGAEKESQSKVPNHTVGSSSNNSLEAIGAKGGYYCVGLELHSAQRLDMFFDVFGYQVDVVKVPNITGRPSWNYVKTVGANMHGPIPADRLATLNKCLDAGCTFWHTTDVGNYGLNNSI